MYRLCLGRDGLVCTLTVRQGVLFSDGTTLTASDVAATLRRAAASERYGYRLRQVASITYSNAAGEVVLTLSSPNQGLIALLDIPVVKSGTENQPVPTGTGPYLFVTGSEGTTSRPTATGGGARRSPCPPFLWSTQRTWTRQSTCSPPGR